MESREFAADVVVPEVDGGNQRELFAVKDLLPDVRDSVVGKE